MDLRSYCRLLARRWRLLLMVFLLVGAALVGAGFLIPKTYTSNVRIVVVPKLSPYAGMEVRQTAESYLADRMKTYAQLVTTNQVLQPVIDSLNLGITVPELVKQIDVTVPVDTLVINVAVKAPAAATAAATANRIANEMPWAVADLEGATTVSVSPVQVSVLQPADMPLHPSSPKVWLNVVVAVVLALIVGVFAAVIADNFDSRIRKRRDVTALSVPYLGGVPAVRDVQARDLLDFTKQSPEVRGVLHRIAIDVLYSIDGTPKFVMVTSPGPSVGKTMVTANIAGALAEAGNRVVFIDADVRGGRLAAQIGIPQNRGITDLVSGRADLDESVLQWNLDGFTVIPCGASAIDVGEMLAGEKFADVMRRLADFFDLVVVDAPPVTNLSEASLFTQNISNVVVVAEGGHTRRAELLRVTTSLRHAGAKILGVVLSRVRDEQPAPADEEDRTDGATLDR